MIKIINFMASIKLFRILGCLTKRELTQFKDYVSCGYVNTKGHLSILIKNLCLLYPRFPESEKNLEGLYKKAFPDQAYNRPALNSAFFELSKLAEQFLVTITIQNDSLQYKKLLAQSLQKRGALDLCRKAMDDYKDELEAPGLYDMHYYKAMMEWHDNSFFYLTPNKLDPDLESPKLMVENLDLFYVMARMRYEIEWSVRRGVLKTGENTPEISEIIKTWMQESFGPKNKVVNIYGYLLSLYEGGQFAFPDDPASITQSFKEDIQLFSAEEQGVIFQRLINYLVRGSGNRKPGYAQELFLLYKFGLEHQLLFNESQHLSAVAYLNIVNVAIMTNNTNYLEEFFTTYTNKLPRNERRETEKIGFVFYEFALRNWQKAYELSREVKPSSPLTRLRIGGVNLRCLYEMYLEDPTYANVLNAQLESFRHFIAKEKTFTDSNTTPYKNLMYFMRQLIKRKPNNREAFASALESRPNTLYKEWVIEKIEQLLSK